MCQNAEIMESVLEKCDIMLDGQIISKELLIQSFASFLSQTVGKRKHNVGIVMHTGSVCFDVLALTYAAIINLISNETEADEIINSMQLGDVVLYGEKKKERYVFDGKIDGSYISKEFAGKPYIRLIQGNGKVSYLAERRWHLIEPYNGTSKRLDGRGIRKKSTNRDDFFVEVLGYKKENVPSVTDTSSVIVMPRDKADMLVKGISLQFGEKSIKLLEMVTASYYTDEDEYCYGGNTGKNEPVLKFAGKISVARKLLYSRQGNLHIGLMILGKESINRGVTELPELINRKSLQYVYLCTSMDFDLGVEILQENEEVEVFACTKDFLLENSKNEPEVRNEYTNELLRQVETVIEKENKLVLIQDAPIEWGEYVLFKRNLLWIKRSDFVSAEKDDFIIHAHSLMNLFITAVFSMKTFVKAKEQGIIDIGTPQEKLAQLENWSNLLPEYVKEKADVVIRILNMTYSKLLLGTGKESWLYDFLIKNEYKKIAIVVPKAYYATIIRASINCSYRFTRNVCVTTPGRFDDTVTYDLIIAIGDVEGRRFNVFRCNSAVTIISLLYQVETKVYTYKKRSAEKNTHYLQSRSTIKVKMEEEQIEEIEENNENVMEVDNEIDDYISDLVSFVDTKRFAVNHAGGSYSVNAEIVAIAVFNDESRAFFSKNYKGYVFDENTGIVKEEGPLNFCEGDSIVFTKNNNETKDIVDSVFFHLIQEGKVSDSVVDTYNKSKLWKKELIKYMHKENISMKEVANRMIENGVAVQEPTICRWLDEDAHTVGPRNINSIAQIGILVGNDDLNNNAEIYFEACREIRSIRRRILEQVGLAIIGKLSGRNQSISAEYAAIYDRVDSLAEVLQIERLIFTESIIPMNMATVYFNSLKDLGKCSTLVDDDVKDFIKRMAYRLGSARDARIITSADELTSRVSTTQLNETLDKLEKLCYSQENLRNKRWPTNVLLATNMISVGIDVARLNVMLLVGQPKLTSEYIQASSRVGRSFPGVAFTMYDGSKSRDRSHYEQFKSYHEAFYKHVEPTGVTPFSKPARERALHSVVISLLRQLLPELSAEKSAINFSRDKYRKEIDKITEYLIARNNNIISMINPNMDSEEDDIRQEIDYIFEKWELLQEGYDEEHFSYGERYMVVPPAEGEARLLKAYNTSKFDQAFDTMMSMRNVDISVGSSVLIWED